LEHTSTGGKGFLVVDVVLCGSYTFGQWKCPVFKWKQAMNRAGKTDKQLISNLLEAVDLMEFGIALMRQNIARRLPNASSAHVDDELERWLIEQPTTFLPQAPSQLESQ